MLKGIIPTAAVVLIAGAGASAYAVVTSGSQDSAPPVAGSGAARANTLVAAPEGPHRLARALKVDIASARPGVTVPGGAVQVARGNGSSCLLFPDGSDSCGPDAAVAAGNKIVVKDDCSTGANNAMLIAGLTSTDTGTAELAYTNGTTKDLPIVGGSWALTGVAPAANDPVPQTITIKNAAGVVTQTAKFPYSAGQMGCLPTS